jgi:hypothetical protein
VTDPLARLEAAQARHDAERAERARIYAESERERQRQRTRRPDARSRVNGGPGRAGRTQGRRDARRRPPIGMRAPYTGGRGESPVVLIYGASADGMASLSSTGEHVEVTGNHVPRWWARAHAEGWAVYCLCGDDLVMAADAFRAGWQRHRHNGRTSAIVSPEGVKCWPLARFFRRRDAETAAEALAFWRAVPVPPRSLVTMATYYLRSTLREPVTFYGLTGGKWDDHQLHRELAYPARQGGWTGSYSGYAYHDINAAYPHALGEEPIPAYLTLDTSPGECPIAAEVTVELPEQAWAPLPIWQGSGRVASERSVCYGWGEVRGWWSWRELRMALDSGATVVGWHRFMRADGPTVDLAEWLDSALALRSSLPAAARPLAKAMTSLTWATFGMTDRRSKVTTYTGSRAKRQVTESTSELPGIATAYVSNEAHARVREHLWREGLAPGGAVYADTDGVIVPRETRLRAGWSVRYAMDHVSIVAPQWYRWASRQGGRLSWCTSGIPDDVSNPEALEAMWDEMAAENPDGTPLVGSLPWSGELMAPTHIDGWGETERPSDWRGDCFACGIVLMPATVMPLKGRTYCVECFTTAAEVLP